MHDAIVNDLNIVFFNVNYFGGTNECREVL